MCSDYFLHSNPNPKRYTQSRERYSNVKKTFEIETFTLILYSFDRFFIFSSESSLSAFLFFCFSVILSSVLLLAASPKIDFNSDDDFKDKSLAWENFLYLQFQNIC